MNRRKFLQSIAAGTAFAASPLRLYAQQGEAYEGRLLVVLHAEGGWDVTAFCDPKMNVAGAPEITQWSRTQETQSAGNIPYAPFANNASFFERHHRNMLVINGVDVQTNSHSTGVLHNWSGRNAAGYPTLTAMFSAHNAPDVPLSYINYGGFADGARLIRYNRLDDINALFNLLQPNVLPWDAAARWHNGSDLARIERFQQERLARQLAASDALPRQRYNMNSMRSAQDTKGLLGRLVDVLPPADQFNEWEEVNSEVSSDLRRQIQLSVLAFRAGVASSADLILYGFDTHSTHDELHAPLFSYLTDSVDYLWEYAEQHGIADRMTLVIGSDFSRTPEYNADDGKDHWPIGSVVVMEKNAPWGNRVVGLTDEAQNAYSINPDTLQRDDSGGTIIYPKHIHKALRRHLGLENSAVEADFRFSNTEDFDFFNPDKSTT
jgi:hypothetical protein